MFGKLKNMIQTGIIEKIQQKQTTVYSVKFDDFNKTDVTNAQHFGFSSKAENGDAAIVIFPDGSANNGFSICTQGNRYEFSLEEGEVAIHNDPNNYVKMNKDKSIEVNTEETLNVKAAKEINITSDSDVKVSASSVTVSSDTAEINGKKSLVTWDDFNPIWSSFISAYTAHTHSVIAAGSPTGPVLGAPPQPITTAKTTKLTAG